MRGWLRSRLGGWNPFKRDNKLRKTLENRERRLRRMRDQSGRKRQKIKALRAKIRAQHENPGILRESRRIPPANVLWIFGAARTGSTWLASMMGDLEGYDVWREPLIGQLFGDLYYVRGSHRKNSEGKHFALVDNRKDVWLPSIRSFVLRGIDGRFRKKKGEERYLVIKEPNGSVGAPLLMEALPESRMILLVRDPRDVVVSLLDAYKEGGWLAREGAMGALSKDGLADRDPDAFVEKAAEMYALFMGNAKDAFESHQGLKALVRYEDLVADTLGVMKRLFSTLDIPVENDSLVRVVEDRSWDRIAEDAKGEGNFYRKAFSGGWREDLTPAQARIVEEKTASLLRELYPTDYEKEGGR